MEDSYPSLIIGSIHPKGEIPTSSIIQLFKISFMIINIEKYRIVWSDKGQKYGAIDVADSAGNTH